MENKEFKIINYWRNADATCEYVVCDNGCVYTRSLNEVDGDWNNWDIHISSDQVQSHMNLKLQKVRHENEVALKKIKDEK